MNPTELARQVAVRLRQEYPSVTTALRHRSAFQLLIATILSSQTTDDQVNRVTPGLFRKYPTAKKMSTATVTTLQTLVQSVNFYRTKAKNISKTSSLLVEHHRGRVPAELDALVALPGVARKTANIVLGTWYKIASGIVVDTHCFRTATRLRLAQEKTPEKTEVTLMSVTRKADWIDLGHLLVWHGRHVCRARNPRCGACVLADLCPSREGQMFHVKQ